MASSLFFNNPNQVRRSLSDKYHSRSKAQMCLKKIIDIISSPSSIQPCENSKRLSLYPKFESEVKGWREKSSDLCSRERGFDIDLNLSLGCVTETEESENQREKIGFSACSGVGDGDGRVCGIIVNCNSSVEKSAEGECDRKEDGNSSGDFPAIKANVVEERKLIEEETREFSEITNLQIQSAEIETKQEIEDGELSEIKPEEEEDDEIPEIKSETREFNSEGYLGLLVEAARVISGNFEDESEHEAKEETQKKIENESMRSRSKRNRCWMLDFCGGFEDISPIVRSKRGRSQVLPYRYRDSVMEPWKRLTRQRSSRVSVKPRPQ